MDPIFAPSNEYELTLAVVYLAVPTDRDRLTAARGTTRMYLAERPKAATLSLSGTGPGAGWVAQELPVVIPDGSYSTKSLIATFNGVLKDKNIKMAMDPDSQRITLYRPETGDDGGKDFKIMTFDELGYESAADMLGFVTPRETPLPPSKGRAAFLADRHVDTQGSRTVTIKASVSAQNNVDPVTLMRKRTVLATLPTDSGDLYQPAVWENKQYRGHRLGDRTIDSIELFLEDDKGLELDPRNHWAVSLEIGFRRTPVEFAPSKRIKSLGAYRIEVRTAEDENQ